MKLDVEAEKQKLKFLVLILICLSLVQKQNESQYSNNFIFDLPALMKQDIVDHFSQKYGDQTTQFYFSFMYSFYSIPNIVLPLLGGVFCDKLGYRFMSMIFIVLSAFGQFIIFFGCYREDMTLMILGRFIFGLGGESLGISSSIISVVWFGGKELSFANALTISIVRTANVLNTILTPKLVATQGMTYAFGFGLVLSLVSLVAQIVLNRIDYSVHKHTEIVQSGTEKINLFEIVGQMKVIVKEFPKIYWLITLLIVCSNACTFNFISFSGPLITDLWLPDSNTLEQNEQITSQLMGIPYLCCTLLCPIIGLYIDSYGQRTKVVVMSSGCLMIGLISLLYFYPIVTMMFIGIGFSIFAATIWTSITYLIPENQLGVAFGVITSLSNLASVIVPLSVAVIANVGTAVSVYQALYTQIVLFFIILSLFTVLISLLFYIEDKSRGVSLDDKDQDKLIAYLSQNNEKINYSYQSIEQTQT